MPGRGRPSKRARNKSGLKNQSRAARSNPSDSVADDARRSSSQSSGSTDQDQEESEWAELTRIFDGLKLQYSEEGSEFEGDDDLEDVDEQSEWEGLEDEEFTEVLAAMAIDEDPNDHDWIPEKIRKKAERRRAMNRKARPTQYVKGPDVMNKSKRTQERYRKSMRNQSALDAFGFSKKPTAHTPEQPAPSTSNNAAAAVTAAAGASTRLVQTTLPIPAPKNTRTRSASILSDPSSVDEIEEINPPQESTLPGTIAEDAHESEAPRDSPETAGDEVLDPGPEDWEEELETAVRGSGQDEIRDWDVLRKQIKDELKKKSRTLPLSRVNQLFILQNFATLRLKGFSRMDASREIARQWHEGEGVWFARRVRALARHYQIFEQLPIEKRGGAKNARSWLHDESVQARARAWLTAQPIGKVTPRLLRDALNSVIFPELNISPKAPLSERTARRWLIKLGWRRTVVRKGVYMDGHERDDVVQYRRDVFLPAMKEFEARMVRYEGPELTEVQPILAPGVRPVIAQYHDECCFHANDESKSLWLQPGKQPLRKKGRGRLIHVSDFINEADGRLVLRDASGSIVRDARRIIYPGSNGDAWWDNEQLLKQVTDAIAIFEAAHPDCQCLFIFDQSSAHASLPPDALRAFDMNKSNGGKQRKQRDTVIPESNPTVELRGRPQKMTTPSGEAKGLQMVLEERGFNVSNLRAKCSPVCPFESQNCCMARLLSQQDDFKNQISMLESLIKKAGHECLFLPKFHCELNPIEMYWGWCKYRYREVPKANFKEAKEVARQFLDACPIEVIRRFINRSWRFISAYRLGLTGKAAEWAVRKQRQHRQVSQRAMHAIESILS
ncbi:hypothetical protein PLICRDRAFT_46228 [Plicaturopsis crispa FD-325 SS-3]|uniref:Tc1-like transposase DDE domain-containing protein n=1 Tax=Plicaturopsis crispa FD-325 SS-3 TaxID=944288 RepID=A0A0C9SXF6_PLICR|nr:hypothetical protein PLICRDRAFT_46228 [Plicaturopsis crispa FD-325 SS-3]